ncbi:DUF4296 domain-containing protein [Flavobacterium sp. ZT3P35]|uniref:DUF4296 domain-containing protein n=1 Tax=Flavobacterium sp. ZT3P35 TaxID=3401727 RepID=UPI003AABEE84
MRKIILFLAIAIVFVSCKEEVVPKPDRLIAQDVMVDIMYDLTVLEAIKNQNPASLDTFKINSRAYIFKKYKIDSIQYAKSNIYYASDYDEYKSMFEQISKRLEVKTQSVDSLIKKQKKKKSVKKAQQKSRIDRDTLRIY